jgi:pyruvate ferredoxin oxidoreductase beta subunit
VFSTPYPESSWQLPWIHSLFGNAAAVGTGIAAALKVRALKAGQADSDVRVVAQGGDGGTTDIGFGCLSGMFERNDDVLYICYDNEADMNTGVQRSGATPPAARTSTTQIVGDEPGNVFGQGKNVPLIAMAHEIPYVGTATIADLRDLEYKVERAMEMRGARYLHVFVTCPLGWGSASRDSIRVARLAKESGLFPVFEAERGEVVGVSPIRRRVPVEEYLKLQRRFGHLFGDPPRIDVIARIQAIADRNIERFGLVDEDTVSATLSAAEPAGLRLPAKEAARAAQLVSEDTGASRLAEETTQGASTAGPEPLRLPEDAVERGANATSPDDEPYRALDEKTRRAR